jgi:hypothetical protein
MSPYTKSGLVAVLTESRFPLHFGQGATRGFKSLSPEISVNENIMSFAEVVCRVELDIIGFFLQPVDVSPLIFEPFLLKNFDVFVRFALIWAEHQEISFAWALGISDDDFRRNDGFHGGVPHGF